MKFFFSIIIAFVSFCFVTAINDAKAGQKIAQEKRQINPVFHGPVNIISPTPFVIQAKNSNF